MEAFIGALAGERLPTCRSELDRGLKFKCTCGGSPSTELAEAAGPGHARFHVHARHAPSVELGPGGSQCRRAQVQAIKG